MRNVFLGAYKFNSQLKIPNFKEHLNYSYAASYMTAKVLLICFQTNIDFSIRMSSIVLKTTNHLLPTSYPSEKHRTIIGACTSMTTKINDFAENKLQPWRCCHFTINSSEIYQCLFAYSVEKVFPY